LLLCSLMLDDLSRPVCHDITRQYTQLHNHNYPPRPLIGRGNLHLLGKNRPSSGILVLSSLSALTLQAHAVMPKMVRPMMAVLPFQFLGWEYQPPVGDKRCLAYPATTHVRGLI